MIDRSLFIGFARRSGPKGVEDGRRGGPSRGCNKAFTPRPGLRPVILSLLALLFVGACFREDAPAREIDRLLAVVNGKVVTEGDWQQAHYLKAILSRERNPENGDRKRELDRLVELELLRQELMNFPAIRAEETEIQNRMRELGVSYAGSGGLAASLKRVGLHESELESYLSLLISVEKFLHFRFRPFVSVSHEEIKSYYQEKLLPRVQGSGKSTVPPVEAVAPQIEEILAQEKVNAAMERWLADLRNHSSIEYFGELPSSEEGARR